MGGWAVSHDLCCPDAPHGLLAVPSVGICDRPHLYQNLSSEEPEVLAPLWEHMSLGSAPGVTSPEGDELLDHLRLNIPRWDESILETLSPTLTIGADSSRGRMAEGVVLWDCSRG